MRETESIPRNKEWPLPFKNENTNKQIAAYFKKSAHLHRKTKLRGYQRHPGEPGTAGLSLIKTNENI